MFLIIRCSRDLRLKNDFAKEGSHEQIRNLSLVFWQEKHGFAIIFQGLNL